MRFSWAWFDPAHLPRMLPTPTLAALLAFSAAACALLGSDASLSFALAVRFVAALVGLALSTAVAFKAAQWLGSRASGPFFAAPVLFATAGALGVGLLFRILGLLVDQFVGTHVFEGVAASLAVLYAAAVFGWSADHASHLGAKHALALGVLATLCFAIAWLVSNMLFVLAVFA